MPRVIADQDVDWPVAALMEQLRDAYPGLRVEVHSPTPDELRDLAVLGAAPDSREIVLSTPGSAGHFAVPLGDDDAPAEVWWVGADVMPGEADLRGTFPNLAGALTAAASSARRELSTPAADEGRDSAGGAQVAAQQRPTVPWELASWSPQVRSMCVQAIWGFQSLNAMASGLGLHSQETRQDLRSALERMTMSIQRYLSAAYAADGSRAVADTILEARAALTKGDLDTALGHLCAFDELRRTTNLPAPRASFTAPAAEQQAETQQAFRTVLAEAVRRVDGARNDRHSEPAVDTTGPTEPTTAIAKADTTPDAATADADAARTAQPAQSVQPARLQSAVTNVWRSDMSAAAAIQADGANPNRSEGGAGATAIRAEEVELVERVDPAAAQTLQQSSAASRARAAWQYHRRPERAPERPSPDRDRDRQR